MSGRTATKSPPTPEPVFPPSDEARYAATTTPPHVSCRHRSPLHLRRAAVAVARQRPRLGRAVGLGIPGETLAATGHRHNNTNNSNHDDDRHEQQSRHRRWRWRAFTRQPEMASSPLAAARLQKRECHLVVALAAAQRTKTAQPRRRQQCDNNTDSYLISVSLSGRAQPATHLPCAVAIGRWPYQRRRPRPATTTRRSRP